MGAAGEKLELDTRRPLEAPLGVFPRDYLQKSIPQEDASEKQRRFETKSLSPIVAAALRVGFPRERLEPATGWLACYCPVPEAWVTVASRLFRITNVEWNTLSSDHINKTSPKQFQAIFSQPIKNTCGGLFLHFFESNQCMTKPKLERRCVRGAPWSAGNRLHGQRTGAFSWRPVLGLSRKTDQFRLDPTQNCAPGWWYDRV